MKKVDIIIPSYKPGAEFEVLLDRLEKQSVSPSTIRVVNTEAAFWDDTIEKRHPGISVLHISKEEFDHGGTRKMMGELSDADIIVFMTQDALPSNGRLIEKLISPIGEGRIRAAYARQLPKKGCRLPEAYVRKFNYPEQDIVKGKEDYPELGIKTFFCSDVCAAYDRNVWLELGGFPDRTIFNEDMIYSRKLIDAGYQIAYCKDAQVYHSHNYSCLQQLRRNFDLGVSHAEFAETFRGISSEGEGIQMVRKTISWLIQKKRPDLAAYTVVQSGCKYVGYLLGKHYHILPEKLVRILTTNKAYWNR